jgi:NADH-quinone oxidoreductase subunit L
VFGHGLYNAHQSTGTLWTLAIVDSAVAVAGLVVAVAVWRRRTDVPALEPAFLQRAWFLDEIYDALIARPAQAFAAFVATVIEAKVIDGAVNGVGALTRVAGRGLRKVQTGYVRQYALGVTLGLVALLAWMVSRVTS